MSRRLLAGYLALTIVVLVALEVPLAIVNARKERQDLTAKVARDAYAAASLSRGRPAARCTALTCTAAHRCCLSRRHRRTDRDRRPPRAEHRGLAADDADRALRSERGPEIAAALRGQTVVGYPALADARHGRCSTSRCPWRQAASCAARFASRIRPRRSTPVSTGIASRSLGVAARRAACRGRARPAARAILRAAAAQPRTGRGSSRRGRPRCACVGARRAAGDPPPCGRAEPHDREARVALRFAGAVRHGRFARAADAADGAEAQTRERRHGRGPASRQTASDGSSTSCSPWREPTRRARPRATSTSAAVAARRVEQWEPLAAEYGVRLVASGDGARHPCRHGTSGAGARQPALERDRCISARRADRRRPCAVPSCTSSTKGRA